MRWQASLLNWYDRNKRDMPWRKSRDAYRIYISEAMLQQTRVDTATPYYERFIGRFPDVFALAWAPIEDVYKHWEGLGYYARARNLHLSAQRIAQAGGDFPDSLEAALALPGVGPYTAAAVLSIAYDKPLAAVDGNVLRVYARLFDIREDILQPEVKKRFSAIAQRVLDERRPGDYNQAVMELGALICQSAVPACGRCPLSGVCRAKRRGVAEQLPVRSPKPEKPVLERTVCVVRCGERTLLRLRAERGLLHGLWEFPGFDGCLSEVEATAALEAIGLRVAAIDSLGPARHVFTHRVWQMTGYRVQVMDTPDIPGGYRWVGPNERGSVAMPSAFKRYIPAMDD